MKPEIMWIDDTMYISDSLVASLLIRLLGQDRALQELQVLLETLSQDVSPPSKTVSHDTPPLNPDLN